MPIHIHAILHYTSNVESELEEEFLPIDLSWHLAKNNIETFDTDAKVSLRLSTFHCEFDNDESF